METRKTWLASVKRVLRAFSPDCREASRLQSESLDHDLTRLQRFGLRVHLLLCRWCRRYGKQIRFLRRAVREHPDRLVECDASTLSPQARERIKRALRDEGK